MMSPIDTTLEVWVNSLTIDFPLDTIPTLIDGDWMAFGDALAQEDTFEENGCPTPHGFNDWQSYAQAVLQVMANY